MRAEHAGTLVHYPTCVDALAPVWEDDYGSISGPSVYRGYSIYTDQARSLRRHLAGTFWAQKTVGRFRRAGGLNCRAATAVCMLGTADSATMCPTGGAKAQGAHVATFQHRPAGGFSAVQPIGETTATQKECNSNPGARAELRIWLRRASLACGRCRHCLRSEQMATRCSWCQVSKHDIRRSIQMCCITLHEPCSRSALTPTLGLLQGVSTDSCEASVRLPAGARTSTVLQRLACLPLADALVSENGGRIFVHDPALPTAAKIVEDTDWCGACTACLRHRAAREYCSR